jgi:hypothetical protein
MGIRGGQTHNEGSAKLARQYCCSAVRPACLSHSLTLPRRSPRTGAQRARVLQETMGIDTGSDSVRNFEERGAHARPLQTRNAIDSRVAEYVASVSRSNPSSPNTRADAAPTTTAMTAPHHYFSSSDGMRAPRMRMAPSAVCTATGADPRASRQTTQAAEPLRGLQVSHTRRGSIEHGVGSDMI